MIRFPEDGSSSEDEPVAEVVVNTHVGEMPEGAELSDADQDGGLSEADPHRALDIDLDMYVLFPYDSPEGGFC